MSGFMDDAEQARADEDDRLEREMHAELEADARAEKGPLPMRRALSAVGGPREVPGASDVPRGAVSEKRLSPTAESAHFGDAA